MSEDDYDDVYSEFLSLQSRAAPEHPGTGLRVITVIFIGALVTVAGVGGVIITYGLVTAALGKAAGAATALGYTALATAIIALGRRVSKKGKEN